VRTFECLLSSFNCLVNMICEGWLGASTTSSPFSDVELEMVQMIDQGGF